MASNRHAFIDTLNDAGIEYAAIKLEDVGYYLPREVEGVIYPKSHDEVVTILRSASALQIALHPYSTGKNWGFGSRSPVLSGGFLVDLGLMQKISKIDTQLGTATIEPGVDQGSLSDALENTDWMLNVTSAGSRSSIIGNALENGVGIYRRRIEDLISLQAVLPDGETVHVGRLTHNPKPDLNIPDFILSGPGIVTRATIALLPKPRNLTLAAYTFDQDALVNVITACRGLIKSDLTSGIPKIFNRDNHRCQLIFALTGSMLEMESKRQRVKDAIIGELAFYQPATNPADESLSSLYAMYSGHPSDRAVHRYLLLPDHHDDLDRHSYLGIRLIAVSLPADKDLIAWSLDILTASYNSVSLDFTYNIWSYTRLGLVIYMHFARNKTGIDAAGRTHDYLYNSFASKGILPYRCDIDHMVAFKEGARNTERKTMLKRKYDPNNIISPGKFIS